MSPEQQRGFTLVELSIALVIIGIVTGGILVGRDMIRAVEIKNVIEDKNKFATAVTQFRERFNALPGDFSRATELWGAVADCSTASTDKKTCDGNGNGTIGVVFGDNGWAPYADADKTYEIYRFWQHLTNAELIEGRFNGTTELPNSSLKGMQWLIWAAGNVTSGDSYFWGDYGNALMMKNSSFSFNAMDGREARVFDEKYDDGKPAQGKIVSQTNPSAEYGGCTIAPDGTSGSTGSMMDAIYKDNSSVWCTPTFRQLTDR